jgi:cystathionine beta-lyase/cystathionine gamma-synthase
MLNELLNTSRLSEEKNCCVTIEFNSACSVSHPDSPNVMCVLLNIQGYEYGRSGNPSRSVLEACLASLDDAKYALCFASGLGAITALVHLLNAGDHMISVDDVYGGTYRYFKKVSI